MAKPIEPTPILTGEDAQEVLKSVEEFTPNEDKAKFLRECVALANKVRI